MFVDVYTNPEQLAMINVIGTLTESSERGVSLYQFNQNDLEITIESGAPGLELQFIFKLPDNQLREFILKLKGRDPLLDVQLNSWTDIEIEYNPSNYKYIITWKDSEGESHKYII